MPTVKFDRVVSCSSEDPNHPAKNLLGTETYKKWKCGKPGEDQTSVVLQLDKSSTISSVDIGNEYSAFIEVLVSRSTGNAEDFKVLLVASSFMSPMEARNGEHPNRVRIFTRDQLSKPAVDEKWDRVKVVCRQPFNRHVQYGLTFLKLHTSQEEQSGDVPTQQTKLGRFVVRQEEPDSDDIRVGSLFAEKRGLTIAGHLLGRPHMPHPTGAAAIMDASKPSALVSMEQSGRKQSPARKKAATPAKDSRWQLEDPKETPRNGIVTGRSPTNKPHNEKEVAAECSPASKRVKTEAAASTSKVKNKAEEAARASSGKHTSSLKMMVPSNAEKKVRAVVPFHKLMNGVTLVISGYQNPVRGNLREAALEMGAKYRPDWGPGCTHLVCAFPNTPKFNQVKGHGKIVRKEWIEDCHSQRKRLPWRRYRMDKKDQTEPESDTEDESESVGLIDGEQRATYATSPLHSEESCSEEERMVQVNSRQPKNERPSLFAPLDVGNAKTTRTPMAAGRDRDQQQKHPRAPTPSSSAVAHSCYDADTDVDDSAQLPSDDDLPPLPYLPNLFKGVTFFLGPSLSEHTVEMLKKYITAYGGDVVSSVEKAEYLITDRIKDSEKLKFDHRRCTAVRPAWVWECSDTKKLVPVAPFELL